jgi:hypothetical protein
MKQNIFSDIANFYQHVLETLIPEPSGSCYLSAYCLDQYFKKVNIESRNVTGELAMIDKTGKNFICYGNFRNLKGVKVGIYHSWCEILVDNEWYVIDPSIKFNKQFLKRQMNFKVSPKIPDTILTSEKHSYNWRYVEKQTLSEYPQSYIEMICPDLKEFLINALVLQFPQCDIN